jgi:SAM-dependent methyltransferase
MTAFSDHFSWAAASYASYRPRYPAALFDWLAANATDHSRTWDCGTGNGQAAVALAERFDEVVATDASVSQLANATRADRVRYLVMTAEQAALTDRSVGVVTVAQALHWFRHAAFFGEVQRVLRPGGLLAVWSYGVATIEPALDALIMRFHSETVGPYWPAERAFVESGYAGIDLPFPEVTTPAFEMETAWTLPQLSGYISTWSAVGRYRTQLGNDPIPDLVRSLAEVWEDPATTRRVRWPLVVRAGRKG